jgi:hypothetical protein
LLLNVSQFSDLGSTWEAETAISDGLLAHSKPEHWPFPGRLALHQLRRHGWRGRGTRALIDVCGVLLIAGRLLHVGAIYGRNGTLRIVGMAATLAVIGLASVAILMRAVSLDL